MEPANGGAVTHHPPRAGEEQTIPRLCHGGSAPSLTARRFGLEKNHTFLKRVESPGDEVACSGRGFQLALAGTPGALSSGRDTRVLSSYYVTVSVWCIALTFQSQAAFDIRI